MGAGFSANLPEQGEDEELSYKPGSNKKFNGTIMKGIETMRTLSMMEFQRKFGKVYTDSQQRLNSLLGKPETHISTQLTSCIAENCNVIEKCFQQACNMETKVDAQHAGKPAPVNKQFEEIDEMKMQLVKKQAKKSLIEDEFSRKYGQ